MIPGSPVTLTVQTRGDQSTVVVYVARYAGGRTGADKPYGDGYGGNGGGMADHAGNFTATWIVAAAAPTGPATVDVRIADAEADAELDVPFVVAHPGPGGGCPEGEA